MPTTYRHHQEPRTTPSPASSGENRAIKSHRNGGGSHALAMSSSDRDYLTTRKVETKTTRNTEKRIQRQLVLQDGRVISAAEPEVVVDVVEDHRTRQEEDVDRADGLPSLTWGIANGAAGEDGEVVDDRFVRKVNTHDVQENLTKKASAGAIVGHVRRKDVNRALRDRRPLSEVVRYHHHGSSHQRAVAANPKVLHSTKSRRKIIDTEDVHNVSRRTRDGRVLTETVRTEQHEVLDDRETPDEGSSGIVRDDGVERDEQRYRHAKRDEFVEYFRTPKDGGQPEMVAVGPRMVTEERHIEKKDGTKRDRLGGTAGASAAVQREEDSERVRRNKRMMRERLHPEGDPAAAAAAEKTAAERKDALTRRPLNYRHEEKVKKEETQQWLERHFGSEWSLTNSSSSRHRQFGGGLMSAHLRRQFDADRRRGGDVKRSMSFTAIPIQVQRGDDEDSTEEVTTTKERIVKTTTTTYRPGGGRDKFSSLTRTPLPALEHQSRRHQHQHASSSTDPKPRSATTHSFIHHQPRTTSDHYRKYNSTQCLLPTPQVEYSLHGGSTIISDPVRPPRAKQKATQQHQDEAADNRSYLFGDNEYYNYQRSQSAGARLLQQKQQQQQQQQQHHHQQSSKHYWEDDLIYTDGSFVPPPPSPFMDERDRYYNLNSKNTSRRVYPTVAVDASSTSTSRRKKEKKRTDQLVQQQHRHVTSASENRRRWHDYLVSASEQSRAQFARPPPLYVTELRREKLYPAASENNLLFDYHYKYMDHFHKSGTSKKKKKKIEAVEVGGGNKPRNYLGFRSLERSDAVSVHSSHRAHSQSPRESPDETGTTTSSERRKGRSAEKRKKNDRKRSQSFAAHPSPRFSFQFEETHHRTMSPSADKYNHYHGHSSSSRHHHHQEASRQQSSSSNNTTSAAQHRSSGKTAGVFGNEYIYDRFERRFVSGTGGSAMRRGHSDLRLDRGKTAQQQDQQQNSYYYKNPRFSHQPGEQGQQQHLRELVHTQEQLEPQRYKTIIFLNGH